MFFSRTSHLKKPKGQKRKKLLKIEKEYLDDHQVKLTVEIDSDPFEKAKHKAARQIAKRIKVPGFRPGKAPYGVILRQVGEGYIVEQALELLIEDQYSEIVKEADITPYGPGTLENVPELDPPTLEFVIPLDGKVELGDYKSIDIPYEPPETGDEEVDEAIESIREQQAVRESVDRPAELGDVVYLRVSGKRTDIEGDEDAIIVEERFSSSTILEGENPEEWPFPGFSKSLLGLVKDDEKTINHQFPEDYHDEDLQGAKAEYQAIITNVQTLTLPEIDDDLAKEASEFETLTEWKDDLKGNLEERNQAAYAEEYDDLIIDHIVSSSTIKYPPQMVEREKVEILRGLDYRLSQQGITKDLYLQIRGIDENTLDEEITPVADERIKRALVLMEIAKEEEIQADPERVQAEMGRTVQAISSSMTPKEAKKFANSQYIPSLATNIVADMLTQTTMDYLRATAKGEPWLLELESPDAKPEDSEAPVDSEGIDEQVEIDGEVAVKSESHNEIKSDVENDQSEPLKQVIPEEIDGTPSETD